jgi:predicted ATP-dependent serine protease
MNDITEGGLSRKTLNIVLAPPGGGKSIFLCHYAASSLKQNLNVLYITCEMAEERIAERIDANLIDVELSSIKYMTKQNFMAKINKVQSAYKGKLIIKEYPTSSANALNFRHLLEELKSKKKFTPDVIIIDYLNICESYKFKKNTSANSYTLVKSVAEELRAMAQDFDVPILTAAQFNREGAASTDPGQENVAESAGLNHTADLMFAIVTTDELEAYGQVMIKQLKNRYSDISRNRKFILGLDKPKMRFFDVNASVNAPPSTPSPQPTPAPQQKAKPTVNAPKLFSGGSIAPVKKEEEYTHKNIFTGKQVSQEFNEWN